MSEQILRHLDSAASPSAEIVSRLGGGYKVSYERTKPANPPLVVSSAASGGRVFAAARQEVINNGMADFDDNRFNSKSVEWATPDNVFLPLNEEFRFTLDVAASHDNAKCQRYFTKDIDALRQDWDGVCWMNPPYGRDVPKWLQKAIDESRRGATTVCLIPARTNTGWFHDLCFKQGEVRFVKGRPKFGDADHGLPFPLAVVVYRPRFQTVEVRSA